jgi:hypothetical protein
VHIRAIKKDTARTSSVASKRGNEYVKRVDRARKVMMRSIRFEAEGITP